MTSYTKFGHNQEESNLSKEEIALSNRATTAAHCSNQAGRTSGILKAW